MYARSPRNRLLFAAGCLIVAGAGLFTACNEHPVELGPSDTIGEWYPPAPSADPEEVDILWVIDNSGSMCQEQEALRDKFDQFVEQFAEENIDFHIGVTTTHMQAISSSDPVARPGHLQSTPQPVPSTHVGCIGDPGDPNDPQDGFEPVRKSLAAGVACTKDPARWESLLEVTDDEIDCARRNDCTGELEELFPKAENGESPYRDIPKVLKAADYRDAGGALDREALARDFACMSLVGTKGNSFEKGLAAVKEAVSPELTGGTVENPTNTSAPNHNFLRQDATFAAIFLTDENDCTHDGTLEECAPASCDLANHPKFADVTPLIDPEVLAEDLVANVASSKGIERGEFDKREVVVASIHGHSERYGSDGQDPPSMELCETLEDDLAVRSTCSNPETFGTAYSGDRYERFLRTFDTDRIYPKPRINDPDQMPGLLCTPGRFESYMQGIAKTIVGAVEQCIYRLPRGCESGAQASCPDHSFGTGEGSCTQFGNTSDYFCDSSVQVRLYPGDGEDARSFEELRDHAYCVAESLDTRLSPGGCVVDPAYYGFEKCTAQDAGVKIKWAEERWFEKLAGFEIETVVSTGSLTRP